MRKKLLTMAGLGFLLGMVSGNLIAWLSGDALVTPALVARMGGQTGAILAQTLIPGLYGAAAMGGTLLYDIEHWSLARSTLLHYLIVAGLYVPMALLLGWMGRAADLLIAEGFQLVVFVLIWLVMYAIYRRQVRELNELREQLEAGDRIESSGETTNKEEEP